MKNDQDIHADEGAKYLHKRYDNLKTPMLLQIKICTFLML